MKMVETERDRDPARRARWALLKIVAQYQSPSSSRAVAQFTSTFLAYLAVIVVMYALVRVSVLLTLALALPAAGLTVRLFIIQHDCGHGSFFGSQHLNDLVGRLCSPFTLTPYAAWRRQHAKHHRCFNNLDQRDRGVDLYSTCTTLLEYQAMSPGRRLTHRLLHHPVVTQIVLPPLIFLLLYRFSFDTPVAWKRERASVRFTNLVLAGLAASLIWAFGIRAVMLVHLPVVAITSIIGVWLFCVQHRFEGTAWRRQQDWHPVEASLEGSSYLKLPSVLQWFTGNIGFHHIHHLGTRVPNYRLQQCHEALAGLHAVTTLTLRDALRAPGYALWDEAQNRMVRFPSSLGLRRIIAGPQPVAVQSVAASGG